MPAVVYNKSAAPPVSERDGTVAGILKALAYFDVFQHPLTQQEIAQFIGRPVSGQVLETSLQELLTGKLIFCYQSFYSLHDNPLLACKRMNSNRRAAQLLPKAIRIGRFLYRFPFVKGIGISGSLSKNVADEKADIDFFIITKANRLWICRTLMHLFKKLTFLAGRQHFYCMNYYLDEEALLLNEQNIFTAVEIKTLLPVSGEAAFGQFFSVNQWVNDWLPCHPLRPAAAERTRESTGKRFIEWIGNNRMTDRIDNYLMQITGRRWQRKEKRGKQNKKGQTMGLVTGKHFARSNPGGLKEKILLRYEEKLIQLGLKGF